MERAWAELKMGASGEPVFGFAASSTLPFIAHGGLVEQASVATIRKAAMQQFGESTLELRTIAILDVGICRLQLLCFHNV